MNIDLESCFVGFLIGVAIYLLLNKFFGVEGIRIRKSSGGNVLPTPGVTQAPTPGVTQAPTPCMKKGKSPPEHKLFDTDSLSNAVKAWL